MQKLALLSKSAAKNIVFQGESNGTTLAKDVDGRFNIMNKQSRLLAFKSLVISFICLSAFSSAFASINKEEIQSLVVNNLENKLRTDLANESVSVKLNNLKEYKISKTRIGLKGDGFCVVTSENNQLPMTFDVKLNSNNLSVADIRYDFAELTAEPEFAPTSNEEVLTKELMSQISRDYKTKNIVIAIDGVEDVSTVVNKKEFTGVGEVRIGSLIWNKIKFDVAFDNAKGSATKVVYKVEQ